METVKCACFWLFQPGSRTMTQVPGLFIGCHLPLATESAGDWPRAVAGLELDLFPTPLHPEPAGSCYFEPEEGGNRLPKMLP